jgi:hypothetical protein
MFTLSLFSVVWEFSRSSMNLLSVITGCANQLLTSFDDEQPQEKTLSQFIETDELLKQFWEIEGNPSTKCWSMEKTCENHFKETTYREANVKSVVSLPIKTDCSLGESRTQALKRLYQIEQRLSCDPKMRRFWQSYEKGL